MLEFGPRAISILSKLYVMEYRFLNYESIYFCFVVAMLRYLLSSLKVPWGVFNAENQLHLKIEPNSLIITELINKVYSILHKLCIIDKDSGHQ
jgi:hypothetical protein